MALSSSKESSENKEAQHASLLRVCFLSAITEASGQLALMGELALVAKFTDVNSTAAYAAVASYQTLITRLFNFVISVTMAQVGSAVGKKRWARVGSLVRIALLAAFLTSLLCAGLLFGLRDPVWRLMDLSPAVDTYQ